MILRAQPIGSPPSRRYVIQNLHDATFWDGHMFVEDCDESRKYATASDACFDMQEILKDHYGQLPRKRYVCPVEIEVYGHVSVSTIARYLHRASVLNIRTHEYGNGPAECLVLPVIHWGLVKEINDKPLLKDVPVLDWPEEDMELDDGIDIGEDNR